jgi:hypothetical protein
MNIHPVAVALVSYRKLFKLGARAESPSTRWACLRGCQMSPEWRSKISLHHFPCRRQGQFVALFDAARQFVAR